MLKRVFDLLFALVFLGTFFFLMIFISWIVKATSKGFVLYWSERVGMNNTLFLMPKFRTMKIDTPTLPTHLLGNPDQYLTSIGRLLRKLSLDELPQLFSILKGDMSFVGPRPALFNQSDLIELRNKKGISGLCPGLTGWAQVNGRDDLSIEEKVALDEYYLHHQSFFLDLKILWMTFFKVLRSEGVKH